MELQKRAIELTEAQCTNMSEHMPRLSERIITEAGWKLDYFYVDTKKTNRYAMSEDAFV